MKHLVLIHGYYKKIKIKLNVPTCIFKLISKYLAKFNHISLFNFKYLGNNINPGEINWEDYVHSTFTTIFAGLKINFDLFHQFKMSFGSKLSVEISLNALYFIVNGENKRSIKSVLGNKWKYIQASPLILLILMDRGDTYCNCNPIGQRVRIYLLNENNNINTEIIYKYIWCNAEGRNALENDATGLIDIDHLHEAGLINYDDNENVQIEYDGILKQLSQEGFIINPINQYAQGWACCYRTGHITVNNVTFINNANSLL